MGGIATTLTVKPRWGVSNTAITETNEDVDATQTVIRYRPWLFSLEGIRTPFLISFQDMNSDYYPIEVMKVNAVTDYPASYGELTVERGYLGTTAMEWPIGTLIGIRVMADHIQTLEYYTLGETSPDHYLNFTTDALDRPDVVRIYSDNTQTLLECMTTYTYTGLTSLPSSAERTIFTEEGATIATLNYTFTNDGTRITSVDSTIAYMV